MQVEIIECDRVITNICDALNVSIEVLRVKSFLSYYDFAEEIDYDLELLINYCCNKKAPSKEVIKKVCDLVSIPFSQFISASVALAESKKTMPVNEIINCALYAAYLQQKYQGFLEDDSIPLERRLFVAASDNEYTLPKLLSKTTMKTCYEKGNRTINVVSTLFVFEDFLTTKTMN